MRGIEGAAAMQMMDSSLGLFAQRGQEGAMAALMGMMMCYIVVMLAVTIVVVIGWWKMFEKAGKPGWAAIIPIYNFIVLFQIVHKPEWWVLLLFVPCVNFVIIILVDVEVAKAFGKDPVFAVGLFLLPVVFFPILGFGKAQYVYGGGGGPPPMGGGGGGSYQQ